MRVRSWIVLVTLISSLGGAVQGQDVKLPFKKGDSVVMALTKGLGHFSRTGWISQNLKLDFEARIWDGRIEVFEEDGQPPWRADWQSAGFPPIDTFDVRSIKVVRTQYSGNSRLVEIKLGSGIPGLEYRFFASVPDARALSSLIVPRRKADSVMKAAYDAISEVIFVGPLSGFSSDERVSILRFLHKKLGAIRVGHEEFKKVGYLTLSVAPVDTIWNDLKVSRAERIGRSLESYLRVVKAFAGISSTQATFGGLKLEQVIRHGTPLEEWKDEQRDAVDAYFPMAAILEFANADITSQQLLDRSIILINGDRVAIDLSKL